MIKKNLVIYYPSFERGGVEENIKNLINNFTNKINVHLVSSISSKDAKVIFKKKVRVYEVKKKKIFEFSSSKNKFSNFFNCNFFKVNFKIKKK